MNAIPLITVTPILRPTYCNRHIADYGRWFQNNERTLTDYWNLLITGDGAGPLGEDDFFLFCRVQHDCEQDRMEEMKRCYNSWSNEQ